MREVGTLEEGFKVGRNVGIDDFGVGVINARVGSAVGDFTLVGFVDDVDFAVGLPTFCATAPLYKKYRKNAAFIRLRVDI